jgi:predicted Zn-dependent protease
MTLTSAQAKALCRSVLAKASFGDVRVHVKSQQTGDTRFAASRPTTGGDVETLEVSVTAQRDGRHATVTGTRTDAASLEALVARAESLAALAPVDPAATGPLGPVKALAVNGRDPKVAKMTAIERGEIAARAIEAGVMRKLDVSGLVVHRETAHAWADRRGLSAFHVDTSLGVTCTCRTADGTGSSKGGYLSHALAGLDASALAVRVAEAANRSRDPKPIAAGRYTVVLMPDAVAELLDFLVDRMDARAAAEGRSFFATPEGGTKVGQALFDPRVTLRSDPGDREDPASPFADDGRPHARTTWIDRGTLAALHAPRAFAERQRTPLPPAPNNIHMAGEDLAIDQLVAKVDRGVLVTRLWYNRMLEPRQIVATGLTRDGTFAIEGGKITHAVKNLRYNDGPLSLLTRLVALGRPERAALVGGRVWVVPPVVCDGFNFESTSEAI